MKKSEISNRSFVISVSLGKGCYRHIRISADSTLSALSTAILNAFEFADDHEHAFFMDNEFWSDRNAFMKRRSEPGDRVTSRMHLSALGLDVGTKFKYLFDFGDEWCFQCRVLRVLDEPTPCALVIKCAGEAPEQYGTDEDEDENEDGIDGDLYEAKRESPEIIKFPEAPKLSDDLYKAALTFRKLQLWDKLLDSQLFAVRYADGTLGYCCVMGAIGEHFALAVYFGDKGLSTYRLISEGMEGRTEFETCERMMSQDCVMLSFENKSDLFPGEEKAISAFCASHGLTIRGKMAYPHFARFRPGRYPWYLFDTADQENLMLALEAAMDVSDKLIMVMPQTIGFSEGPPIDRSIPLLEKVGDSFHWSELPLPTPKPTEYPCARVSNDLTWARLEKACHGGEWACDVIMLTDPVYNPHDDGQNAPFFPYVLLVVDNCSGDVLCMEPSDGSADYAGQFGEALLQTAIAYDCPTRILTCNERTRALLAELAPRMGAKLSHRKIIQSLDEAEQSVFDHMRGMADGKEDYSQELLDFLSDPTAYNQIPDALLQKLRRLADTGALPDEIVALLKKDRKER